MYKKHFIGIILPIFFSLSLAAQREYKHTISAQVGPETGISAMMPKLSYRTAEPGWYFGLTVSWNLIAVSALTIAPNAGYRYRGAAFETSLAFTAVNNTGPFGKDSKLQGGYLNINPKVMLGHQFFVGFGPSFYLFKPKIPTETLWDDVGRYNFEMGGSEWLKF